MSNTRFCHVTGFATAEVPQDTLVVTAAHDGSSLLFERGPALRSELNNPRLLVDGRTVGQALADDMRKYLEEWLLTNKGLANG